ncbi:MAG: iron-containing alcohol dehydrogenase [Peptostreptococcaceae bacterium]|nr:iron-containing alcohol dehydrogenase [Peptostreptococcaceae bacterium]
MEFRLHLAPLIEFGEGKIDQIGDILYKDRRKKVLIITGKKSSKAQNALERIKESLNRSQIEMVIYDEITQEPDTEVVDLLRDIAKTEQVDSVIGLGGGSPMDVAKVVAGLFGQEKKTIDYLRKEEFVYSGLPFYAIPTTSGTASEVTLNAVLLDRERNNKYSISDTKFMPIAAIIDPELTYGLSPEITAATGMDAFTHAIESYVSYESNEFTKFLAQEAVLLILKHYDEAMEEDKTARAYMAKGSLYAGLAFAQTGVGLSHAISHPLGAIYHIPHGVANAILIPKVIHFNMKTSHEEYRSLEQVLGIDINLGDFIQNITNDLPIKTNLKDYGFKMEDAERIAELAMTSRSYLRNPRIATKEEIMEILMECY